MAGQGIGEAVGLKNSEIPEPLRSEFESLVHRRTGMAFGFRRVNEMEQTVLAAAARAHVECLEAYYEMLASSPTDSDLWDDLVAQLTIGETYFFRNTAHFDALRWEILPPLIRRRRSDKRLRIWSAGCSTGEEAFSLAILLCELIPGIEDWRITILGTDINKESLQRARDGLFRPWSLRKLTNAQKGAYFTPRGEEFELAPRIREMATFSYLNLTEETYPALETNTTALDLILCRNVAIYFSLEAIQQTADRFYRCLLDDGWLITGAAETNSEIYARFAARSFPGAVLYQKTQSNMTSEVTPLCVQRPVIPRAIQAIPRKLAVVASSERYVQQEDSDRHPAAELERARSLLSQGDEPAAVATLCRAVAVDPQFTEAYYQLSRLHANRGRLAEAREWCMAMLRSDPLSAEGHFTLGLIDQEEGQTSEAAKAFRKALYLSPDFILAHHGLSRLLLITGETRQAEQHRAIAMKLVQGLADDEILPGSENLRAGQLRNMLRGTQ